MITLNLDLMRTGSADGSGGTQAIKSIAGQSRSVSCARVECGFCPLEAAQMNETDGREY